MPYDIARALENPNIIGNALAAGRTGMADGLAAKGRADQNRLAQLSSEAYTTPTEGRNNLLQRMAAIDPDSAAKQSQAFATMDANQKAQLAAGLEQFARTATGIAQDPDEQRAAAAYGQLIDKLAATGKDVSQFRNVPPKIGARMALVQIASTKDLLDQAGLGQGYTLAPGSARFTSDNRKIAAQPVALQYHDVPMGQSKAAGVFDPSTGQLRPAAGAAQPPAGDPMQPFIAQANQAVQLGADPAKVEQWLLQQAQQMGAQPQGGTMGMPMPAAGMEQPAVQPQAAPAQFGVGTPKPSAADNSFTQLTPAEVAQLGLPPGTVAQRGSNGKIDVVTKPSATDARLSMQARAAKGALSGSLQQLDRLKQAAMDLKGDPGLGGVTGFRGHIPDLPGSDAARARAELDTLKSQIGFGVLQQMREMSKTGGALGSVSDRENTMLQNNLAALSTNQSAEDFARSLDKIINYVDDAKARMQGAYQDTYGDVADGEPAASPAPSAAPAGGVDDLLSKYGVH
jgi:hypothetical protein